MNKTSKSDGANSANQEEKKKKKTRSLFNYDSVRKRAVRFQDCIKYREKDKRLQGIFVKRLDDLYQAHRNVMQVVEREIKARDDKLIELRLALDRILHSYITENPESNLRSLRNIHAIALQALGPLAVKTRH